MGPVFLEISVGHLRGLISPHWGAQGGLADLSAVALAKAEGVPRISDLLASVVVIVQAAEDLYAE